MRGRWCLWHHLVLPGVNLAAADYHAALQKLRAFQPRVLFGIPSDPTGLADYLERENPSPPLHPIDLVVTWTGPVYEHDLLKLQRVFKAPVSNIYSSRELGHIACVCPEGRLHVNEENYLVEMEPLPSAGESGGAAAEVPGEILVTPLFETPMSLMRYRTGDIGQWAATECPCGRKQHVIERLHGRLIAPNFWCHMFMRPGICDHLSEFQVVLGSGGAVRFRIARRPSYTPDTESVIRDFVRQHLATSEPPQFEYVERIEPHPSGKFQMVVSEGPAPLHARQSLDVSTADAP